MLLEDVPLLGRDTIGTDSVFDGAEQSKSSLGAPVLSMRVVPAFPPDCMRLVLSGHTTYAAPWLSWHLACRQCCLYLKTSNLAAFLVFTWRHPLQTLSGLKGQFTNLQGLHYSDQIFKDSNNLLFSSFWHCWTKYTAILNRTRLVS